jgi:hypothetical protein
LLFRRLTADDRSGRQIGTARRLIDGMGQGEPQLLKQRWWAGLALRAVQAMSRIDRSLPSALIQQDALVEQSTSMIQGPTAPLELLTRLAGRCSPVNAAERSRPTPNNLQPAAVDAVRQVASNALYPPDRGDGDVETFVPEAGSAERYQSAWVPSPVQTGTISGFEALDSRAAAPPTVNPPLPTSFSAQLMGASALPIAAEIARRDARAEAGIAEEDLDLLAEKIKRILDDEARRHGIDV